MSQRTGTVLNAIVIGVVIAAAAAFGYYSSARWILPKSPRINGSSPGG